MPLPTFTMPYTTCTVPSSGSKISISKGKLNVPDQPVIPFIRGDGTGRDIWASSVRVFDDAVEKTDREAFANVIPFPYALSGSAASKAPHKQSKSKRKSKSGTRGPSRLRAKLRRHSRKGRDWDHLIDGFFNFLDRVIWRIFLIVILVSTLISIGREKIQHLAATPPGPSTPEWNAGQKIKSP